MANKLLKALQECYYDLKNETGQWRVEPIGIINTAKTSEKNIEYIKQILDIISTTDDLSEQTKLFITHYIKIVDINKMINDIGKKKAERSRQSYKEISYSSTAKKIAQDNEKLEHIIGMDTLKNLIYNIDLDEAKLKKLIKKLPNYFGSYDKLRSNLAINLSDKYCKSNNMANNEEFFEILDSLSPYLVQRMDIILEILNNNRAFIEYFNYLLSKEATLDDNVRTDRERLVLFLNNKDYSLSAVKQDELEEIEDTKETKEYDKQDIWNPSDIPLD